VGQGDREAEVSELEEARARRDELAELLAVKMGRMFPALDGMPVDVNARTAEEHALYRSVVESLAAGEPVGDQPDTVQAGLLTEVFEIAGQWIAADEEVEELEARGDDRLS
jgi:hypothetical protein